jgi:hypothetical protein
MKRFLMYSVLGLLLTAGFAIPRAKADSWDRQTMLTVRTPVSFQGVVLLPGKYFMQLQDSNTNRAIVQIFNADDDHLVTTLLASESWRINTPSKTVFTYYETQPGQSAAIRSWYYPGENTGIYFAAPKNVNANTTSVSSSQPVSATPVGE